MSLTKRQERISSRVAMVLGWATYAALVGLMIWGLNTAHHNDLVELEAEWPIREAVVASQDAPVADVAEAYRPSTLRYDDFDGRTTTAAADLPYSSDVGDTVAVRVSREGTIYVPDALHQGYDPTDGDALGYGFMGVMGAVFAAAASWIAFVAYVVLLSGLIAAAGFLKRLTFSTRPVRVALEKLDGWWIRLRKRLQRRPRPSRRMVQVEAIGKRVERLEPSDKRDRALGLVSQLKARIADNDNATVDGDIELLERLLADEDQEAELRQAGRAHADAVLGPLP